MIAFKVSCLAIALVGIINIQFGFAEDNIHVKKCETAIQKHYGKEDVMTGNSGLQNFVFSFNNLTKKSINGLNETLKKKHYEDPTIAFIIATVYGYFKTLYSGHNISVEHFMTIDGFCNKIEPKALYEEMLQNFPNSIEDDSIIDDKTGESYNTENFIMHCKQFIRKELLENIEEKEKEEKKEKEKRKIQEEEKPFYAFYCNWTREMLQPKFTMIDDKRVLKYDTITDYFKTKFLLPFFEHYVTLLNSIDEEDEGDLETVKLFCSNEGRTIALAHTDVDIYSI